MRKKKIIILLLLVIVMCSCGSWLEVMDSSLRTVQQFEKLTDKSKRTYDDCKKTFTPQREKEYTQKN